MVPESFPVAYSHRAIIQSQNAIVSERIFYDSTNEAVNELVIYKLVVKAQYFLTLSYPVGYNT